MRRRSSYSINSHAERPIAPFLNTVFTYYAVKCNRCVSENHVPTICKIVHFGILENEYCLIFDSDGGLKNFLVYLRQDVPTIHGKN